MPPPRKYAKILCEKNAEKYIYKEGSFMTTTKRRALLMLSALAALCIVAGILFCNAADLDRAQASNTASGTNTDGEWTGSQQTRDLIPEITSGALVNQGWTLANSNQINPNGFSTKYGYAISAFNNSDDIGNKNYTGGVYYTVTLSDADRVKADLGQLTVNATSINYFQASSQHHISIRIYFFDSGAQQIGQAVQTYTKYYVGTEHYTLNLPEAAVPAGTCTMQVWFSNWGTLSGRPFIALPTCYLHDKTAPAATGVTLEKTNVVDSANNAVIAGNTVKYFVEFNEKVSIVDKGTATLKLNGSDFVSSNNAEIITQNGKSKACYTFTMPDKAESGTVQLTSVSGLYVKDEAGNTFNYSSSNPSAPTLQYYKAMSVSQSMSHLTFAGESKATYNSNYTATLSPSRGYDLPQTITVTAGGSALSSGSDYNYDSRTGNVTIYGSVIKNDLRIEAAGVAKQIGVTFDKQLGSGGVESVTATFDSAMPSVSVPSRIGYTFAGYYTQSGDVQYYDASGRSTRNCDFVDAITLYARWIANKYTINFDANAPKNASSSVQGNTASSARTYDEGELPLPNNGFALRGWTFTGWATRADGGVVYTNRQAVQNLSAASGGTFTLYAVWQANTHNVTLNATGGSNSGSLSATYDSTMPGIAARPSRYGYNFVGYFDQPSGGVQYYNAQGVAFGGKTFTTDSDIVLYAQWQAITYTIVLYSDGNYISSIENVVFGKLQLPNASEYSLSRDNFDFVGWNLYDEQNWAMYYADTSYPVGLTGDQDDVVVLYASWLEKAIYSLFYDANGGSGAPAATQAHVDESIKLSDTAPTRADYTFVGWATDDSAEADYLPGSDFVMGNAVVTLYAVWKHNPALSYNAGEGDFTHNVAMVYPAAGTSATVTQSVPTRTGYDFVGWATTDGAASAQYHGGDSYTMPDEDVVMYAVWQRKVYEVTQSVAAGYSIAGLSDSYSYGDEITFTVSGTTPKVYINGTRVEQADGHYSYTVTGSVSVVVADASSLVLLYSANGGDDAPTDGTIYSQDGEATVSDVVPVRTGYSFLGWSANSHAETPDYEAGSTVTFEDADVTLYAVWQANSYTVKYSAAGCEGTMPGDVYTYGSAGKLSDNIFAKQGFVFVGWALSEGGECVFADGDAVLNLTANDGDEVTLYAVWQLCRTAISFDSAGGGGGSANLSVSYGEVLPDSGFMAPVRRGYTFGGYFTEKNGGGDMLFDADMRPVNDAATGWTRTEANLTLYAFWVPTPETMQDSIDSVQDDLSRATEALQSAIESNQSDIEDKISDLDSAYQAANELLRSDLAAADKSLEERLAALEQTVEQANTALRAAIEAVQTNLNSAAQQLQNSIDSNKADIDAKLEDLDAAYKAADALLRTELSDADDVLDGKIAALQQALSEADSALRAAIDNVQNNLNAAQQQLQDAINANEQDIEAKVEALDKAYKAADDLLRSDMAAADSLLRSDLNAAQDALNSSISALQQTMKNTDDALQAAIDAVQTNLNSAAQRLQAAIDANEEDIESKFAALNEAYQAADDLLRSDMAAADSLLRKDMNDADDALNARIDALEQTMRDTADALQAAIDVVQDNLDEATQRLQDAIDANEQDIEAKVDALNRACQAADDLLRSDMMRADSVLRATMTSADHELNVKINELYESLRNVDRALQAAVDVVQGNLDEAARKLKAAIDANEEDIESKVAALEDAYKAADAIINSSIEGLRAQDGALAQSIAALDVAYKAADKALWDGIRKVEAKHNALQQQSERTALVYLIINIVLGCVATALVVTLIVKTARKGKTK